MEQDTIAAISTAVSNSGIGIIRISGKDAVAVADRVYRSGGGKKRLADQPTHTIHYGYIVDQGETVDEVLVMLMRGPKSFTAEDRFSGFTTGWKALRRRSRMSGIWCLKQKSLTRTERWIVNRSPKYGRH